LTAGKSRSARYIEVTPMTAEALLGLPPEQPSDDGARSFFGERRPLSGGVGM
jgi:hypothetical protein